MKNVLFPEVKVAHIDKNGAEQSVFEHLENVGCYCGVYARKAGLESCGTLTGQLHDLGKLTDDFDAYIKAAHAGTDRKRKGPDHSTAGAVWILSLLSTDSSAVERLTAQMIAMAIMWHHGGLGDVYTPLGESPYLKRIEKLADQQWYEQYKETEEELFTKFSKESMKQLFVRASKEVETVINKLLRSGIQKEDVKYNLGILCKYLYSCLIDADRYDTVTFMDGETMKLPQDSQPVWENFSRIFEEKMKELDFEKPINQLRTRLSQSCFLSAQKQPGIYTLNCPTGSGKTLSSLRYAVHHAKDFEKERIFYIIPLISIIEQNSKAIRKFLNNEEKGMNSDEFILELHSAMEMEITDEKELKAAELLAERMDMPIVITTMVRFLNTFFKKGTRNPRAIHNFSNSIIVFDEIQTLPVKCIGMFNSLLNSLVSVCNVTIILSTATQPILDKTPGKAPSLRMSKEPELSGCTEEIREKFRRTCFDLSLLHNEGAKGNSVTKITHKMAEYSNEGKSILGVFNTKKSALKVYESLKNEINDKAENRSVSIYLLSTNLCPAHRRKKLDEIRKKLDKKEQVIVISTQLIESGVDISFDIVFRALAGLDSLIQAAGRCNRNGEKELGIVFLINPDFESLQNLDSIKKGKQSVEKLIRQYIKCPEQFNGQLDSQKAIEYYYKDYFEREKGEFLYPFKIDEKSRFYMYDLLNRNENFARAAYGDGVKPDRTEWTPALCQSFSTAGHYFDPIDSQGISVIVPYEYGKALIAKLLSQESFAEKKQLLRKTQQYCVNISNSKHQQIAEKSTYYEELGIYVLKDDYYDPDVKGLLDEPNQKVLMY